jgi:homoserine kinase
MVELRRDAVRVLVPATSANLGPAFDSGGLALGIYDELVAMSTEDAGVLVEVLGEGESSVPRDETHLVVRSMRRAFDWMGAGAPGFVLRCTNVIPHGRGLGSSAAAIVGGMVLARAMVVDGVERMSDGDLLHLALGEESHPDNLAAALLGGLTVAWIEDDGRPDAVRLDPHPDVHAVALVPPTSLATAKARALLPESVLLRDAAANVARAALLVHALTTDPSRLMTATEDRLHQQCRAEAYPESVALVAALRGGGVPAVISGAGPTVLAFTDRGTIDLVRRQAPDGWTVLDVPVAAHGAREVPVPLD